MQWAGCVVGIATGYGLDGPGIESRWGARFSAPVQTGPGPHPASCKMGTVSFPGVKSGRNVTLTTHPLLVPWSWTGRAVPLLPLWAVRPVQSISARTRVYFTLSACTRVHFTLSACTRVHFTLSACTRVHFTLPFVIYMHRMCTSTKVPTAALSCDRDTLSGQQIM